MGLCTGDTDVRFSQCRAFAPLMLSALRKTKEDRITQTALVPRLPIRPGGKRLSKQNINNGNTENRKPMAIGCCGNLLSKNSNNLEDQKPLIRLVVR